MYKKLCLFILLNSIIASPVFAGMFYFGPGAVYQNIQVHHSDTTYDGISPKLSFGYGFWIDGIYTALELNSAIKSLKIYSKSENYDPVPRLKSSVTVSLLPGIPFDETLMGYGRVGYQYSYFHGTDKGKGGIQVGVGLAYSFIPCWEIRAEYDYTKYGNVDNFGKLMEHNILLGLIYRFYSY